MRAAPRKPAPYLTRRLPAYLLPALVLLAVAAALLWLSPVGPALAQDDAGPRITAGPAITSSPASGDTYRFGEVITVALAFGEPVTVTGKPRLGALIGEQRRWANYSESTGDGATLVFAYTVQEADRDEDGIRIRKNALRLNGGSIQDAGGNDADLKHPALPNQAGHKVNGAPDEPEPTPTPTPEPANSAPQFADTTAARSVDENAAAGDSIGDPVIATDSDGDTLTYALAGADAGSFDFDTATGQITVKDALDYEAKASYSVTVTAADPDGATDSTEIAISVVNVDEPGAVALSTDTPQAGSAISASLTDPDGSVSGEGWTWESSADGNEWTAIAGATGAAYTPADGDVGKYLRASASYADGHGSGKSAQAQAASPVAAAPPPNNAPQFADATAARSVDENAAAGENIGDPVAATDSDGDTLTYALTGSDAGAFDFDTATGQIAVKDALDYEDKNSYSVTVTVHDGKNADGEADTGVDDSIEVTISVANVDEAGQVFLDTAEPLVGSALSASVFDPDGGVSGEGWTWESSADGSKWAVIAGETSSAYTPVDGDAGGYLRASASYADAQGAGKSARSDAAGPVTGISRQLSPNADPLFAAESAARSVDENTAAGAAIGAPVVATDDDGDTLAYALGGADAGAFDLDAASGQITVKDALDHEARASYTLTVTVSDGKNAAGEVDDSVDDTISVTVSVVNLDEAGAVALDPDTTQAGSAITASLSDPDGGITGETWIWERSADGSDWTAIAGATEAAYTPTSDDVGQYLRATASYADGEGTGKIAQAATAGKVAEATPASNEPPSVGQGPAIASSPAIGDAYVREERIIVRVTFSKPVTVTGKPRLGVLIGEQRRWANYSESTDDGATLVFAYTVQEADRDEDGIRIRKNALRLNGGSIQDAGGNDADLTLPPVSASSDHKVDGSAGPLNNEPEFAADTAARSVAANATAGAAVGDPVTASDADGDTLTYALSGADAASFGIDSASGQITVKGELDFENKASYSVTVTVHDGKNAAGEADATVDAAVAVTITAAIAIVEEPPEVTEAPLLNSPAIGDTYGEGEEIVAILTFSEPVAVSGAPYLDIVIGEHTRRAAYLRSDTSGAALVFAYTVQQEDRDDDGISIAANSVGLNGGSITGAGGNDAVLEHPAIADLDSHKVDGSASPFTAEPQTAATPQRATIKPNSSLIPPTIGRLDRFRLMFVTEGKTQATSTDIGTYNSFVQGEAAKSTALSGFSDRFTAIGSTDTVDARDNTFTNPNNGNHASVPIYWVNGDKVADNNGDFYDGSWDSVEGRNQHGSAGGSALAARTWTGSLNSGIKERTSAWRLGGATPGLGTLAGTAGRHLTFGTAEPAGFRNSLYALSPVITIESPTVLPNSPLIPDGLTSGDRFRLMFVTQGTTAGTSTKIGDYNRFAQSEAAKDPALSAFSRLFTAVLSTDAVDARDNTYSSPADGSDPNVPIYWVHGDKVADNKGDFYDGSWDSVEGRNQHGNGKGNFHPWIWSGSDDSGTKESTDGERLGDATPSVGLLEGKHGEHFDRGSKALNTADRPVYALSPVITIGDAIVPANWPLLPDGAKVGDRFRLMFVTDGTTQASSKKIGFYNDFVQDEAAKSPLLSDFSRLFTAIGSTDAVDARDNTFTSPDNGNHPNVPIYWVNGDKVADNKGDFYDSSWDSLRGRNQHGRGHAPSSIWTGSHENGTKATLAGARLGNNPGPGTAELSGRQEGFHLDNRKWDSPQSNKPMYAVSPVITVGAYMEVPDDWAYKPTNVGVGESFRLLFMTSQVHTAGSSNPADYSRVVQDRASENDLLAPYRNGFLAFLSTQNVDARDYTHTNPTSDGAGEPIYWMNGDRLADDYDDFYCGGGWDSQVARNETGAEVQSLEGRSVWTGSECDGTRKDNHWIGAIDARAGKLAGSGGGASKEIDSGNRHRTESHALYGMSVRLTVRSAGAIKTPPSPIVPPNWPHLPSGLNPGDRFRVLFITRDTRDASSKNIGDYNAFVQREAAKDSNLAAFSDQFRVVGSTQAVHARNNAAATGPDVKIYWVGGAKVADNVADFYDDTWDSYAGKDQHGASHTPIFIYTGSNNDGTTNENFPLGNGNAVVGTMDSSRLLVSYPIDSGNVSTLASSFYGISPVLTVGKEMTAPANWLYTGDAASGEAFRLMFVTSRKISASAVNQVVYFRHAQDRASEDRFLRPYRAGFRALVSTPHHDARDLTFTKSGLGEPIHWVGGAQVADNHADFYDASWDSHAATNEHGEEYPTERGPETEEDPRVGAVWTGSNSNGTKKANESLSADRVGFGELKSGKEIYAVADASKGLENRLYGLSLRYRVGSAAAAAPAKPADLSAVAGPATVSLRWTNPGDSGIAAYQYRQKEGNGAYGHWRFVPDSNANTVSHNVSGLTNDTEYSFQVRAVNAAGIHGPASEEMSATPSADAVIKPAPQTVPRDWTYIPKDTNNNPLFGPGEKFRLLFVTTQNVDTRETGISHYNDFVAGRANRNNALKPFKDEFRAVVSTETVDARDNTGTRYTGDKTSATTDDSDLGVPIYWLGGVKVADEYRDFYDGSWSSKASKNESGADHPAGGHMTGSNADGTKHATNFAGATDSVQFGSLFPDASPLSQGSLSRTLGASFTVYALSPVITVQPPDKPAAPTGLTASAGDSQVTLRWNDPGNSTITKYQYHQLSFEGEVDWGDIPGSGATTTMHTVKNLTNGVLYGFNIRAVNAGGNSPVSNVASATPKAASVAPSAPTGLMATAGSGQITLTWTDPGDTSITRYQYQQKEGTGSYGGWTDMSGSGATTTTHAVSGLNDGTLYAFKIRSVNAGGNSPASAEASATTRPPSGTNGLRVVRADLRESRGRVWVEIRPELGLARTTDLTVTMRVEPVAPATNADFTIYAGTEITIRAGETVSENGLIIYPVDNQVRGPDKKELTVTGTSVCKGSKDECKDFVSEPFGPATVRIWDDDGRRPGEPEEVDVSPAWAMIPKDANNNPLVKPGESFRLLFATSDTINAESWDINRYNSFVRDRAGRNRGIADIRGRFRALVSTLTVDASENTWTDHDWSGPDVGIYWVGGAKVSDDYDDFWLDVGGFNDSMRWHSLDARTETGAPYTKTNPVFTGSLGTGQAHTEYYAGADRVAVGDFTGVLDDAGALPDPTPGAIGYVHPLARELKPEGDSYSLLGLSPVINVVQPPTVTLYFSSTSISEDGGTTTLVARQDRISSHDTTMEVEITGGGALEGVPNALRFTIPRSQFQSAPVTLTAASNNIDEPGDRQVTFRIKTDTTLRNDHVGALAGPAATLTVVDDDPTPVMTLGLAQARIAENGGATASLTISLDRPSSKAVTANIGLSAPAGYEGEKYWTAGTDSVTFSPGQTSKTINPVLTSVDDNVYGPEERRVKVTVTLSGDSGIAAPGPVTVVIEDNEAPPIFRLELSPATVDEDGNDVNVYGRVLGELPRREVKLKLTLEPLTGHTVGGAAGDAVAFSSYGGGDTLVRRSRDRGRFGYVRISPRNNDRNEIDKRFRVTAEFLNYQPFMGSLPEPVILTIRDDDEGPGPALRVSIDRRTIPKAGGNVAVTVSIDTPAAEDTTVLISLRDVRWTSRTTSEYPPSNRATFPDGDTVTIPAHTLEGKLTLKIKSDPKADGVELAVQGDVTSDGWVSGTHRAWLLMGGE